MIFYERFLPCFEVGELSWIGIIIYVFRDETAPTQRSVLIEGNPLVGSSVFFSLCQVVVSLYVFK